MASSDPVGVYALGMSRSPRLNQPGIPQHVVQRGNNRQPCFQGHSNYLHFLEDLKSETSKSGCELHAYVLMTNHFHLLVTPSEGDGVSRLLMGLGRKYVQYYNQMHERTGTLWGGRFRSSAVLSPEYCLACYRYIEMNPVRARLVTHPGNYLWSSYRVNGMGAKSALISPHRTWMRLGRSTKERAQMYRSLIGLPLEEGMESEIRSGVKKGTSVGQKERE